MRIDRGIKFHVAGSVFVPTAALDLRANDNETSLVSGGVIARQLTTYRWKNNGSVVAFGDASVEYANREVNLRVSRNGHILAETYVEFVDRNGAGQPVAGYEMHRPWMRRREGP